MLLFENATVLTDRGVRESDVLVDGTKIAAVEPVARANADRVIDATGLILGPGLVDVHVHLREPGQEHKEDIASGTRAAAAGGFTALVAMPNTQPPLDDVETHSKMERASAEAAQAAVSLAAAATISRRGEELVDMDALWETGVRIFTDDGDPISDERLMRLALAGTKRLPGAVIAQHAEDRSLAGNGHLHEGETSRRLEVVGIPPDAETVMIARDIGLVRRFGGRLHIQHLSTAGGVDLVAEAKADDLDVTCEVTPHHLALTDQHAASGNPNFKMYPPLREEMDRKALREGLRSGIIDLVATDHAPHTTAEKSQGLEKAPRGVIGLETAVPIVGEVLDWDVANLFERLSSSPARLAGLDRHGIPIGAGTPANLVLIDPRKRWRPDRFVSKAENSPFLNESLVGRAVMTVWEGSITWEELN